MKKYKFILHALLFFATSGWAQSHKITILTGKLRSEGKTATLPLTNIDGINVSLPVKQQMFSISTSTLAKGFYELGAVGTVYLAPGFKLVVQPCKVGGYTFAGNGAVENNALQIAKRHLYKFLPANKDGQLDSIAYFIDVPVFVAKLDSFQKNGERLISKSSDTFFRKYAALDLNFYCKHLLNLYVMNYGIDQEKMLHLADSVRKLNPTEAGFVDKVTSLMKSMYKKEMAREERLKLVNIIHSGWPKDNEILFKNSFWYREAVTNFLAHMSYNPKYLDSVKHTTPLKLDQIKREDADIKKLIVAKGEISNPYILSYFTYTITSAILKSSTDTATINRYYNEFVSSETRHDYLADIKEIYHNLTAYKENKPAPAFTYKDQFGKEVSLQSLYGKYVYIDIWATWCGPCVAEIPHLQKLETDYIGKNIQFISISVDEQHNKPLWKEFVKRKHLGGIQLISDNAFESSFIKKMNINSIPRFILIDPTGKIVSANALRPSDEKLRQIFETLL